MQITSNPLYHLAGLYGIQTSYMDMDARPRSASDESLLAILKALGAPVNSLSDVPGAIREKYLQRWRKPVEPVMVCRENETPIVDLRLPARAIDAPVTGLLELENGEQRNLRFSVDLSSIFDSTKVGGVRYFTSRINLPQKLPPGYHKLYLELHGQASETLIISAPLRAWNPNLIDKKTWGVFLPLYALRTHDSWGTGSFSELGTLMKWASSLGGRIVATLPLLASFFDNQFGPGPYLPASRLFWNELYIDINGVPELKLCQAAQDILNSTGFQNEISALHRTKQVKYRPLLEIKRKVLEKLAECFFANNSMRHADFRSFMSSHPYMEEYACFRAAGERNGVFWSDWPQAMQNGKLKQNDYPEKSRLYHLYTQWICHEQVLNLYREFKNDNSYLYLDMPIGVHPYSFDVWQHRSSFIPEVNAGAPPDPVFTGGQNWSFPPLHPEKLREHSYGYLIKSLQHQLECASMLRIDHIMGFHRLFCIPKGMEANEGIYVSYPAEELYAILCLESCRHKTIIVGEDLGMVPPEVRPMMEKNGVFRMFVGQFQLIAENQLGLIPSHSAASLNTHDMFPFASFWQDKDIAERWKLKLIDVEGAQREMEQRQGIKKALLKILKEKGLDNDSPDTDAVLRAVLNLLAASPAFAFLINLEDLWLETHPQNIPGTNRTQNWSRKAHFSFEEFSKSPSVIEILQGIDGIRKGVASKQ